MTTLHPNRRKYDGLSMEEKVDEALLLLEEVLEAFPDGPLKHRQAHEAWIAARRSEAEFWKELKLDIAKKGAWGLIIVIVGLLLVGVSVRANVWFR